MSTTTAPPSSSSIDVLSVDNNNQYWAKRWSDANTPWKMAERKSGLAGFYKNIRGLAKQPELALDEINPDDAESGGGPYHGSEVFVPLCGDSGAVAFFFRRGFNVTGCDLCEDALRAAMKECENGSVDAEEGDAAGPKNNKISIKWTETEKDSLKFFSGVGKHNTVTLVVGDFFKVPLGKYDFIYDRASGVALPPPMRPAYFSKIRQSLIRASDLTAKQRQRSALFSALPAAVCSAVWFGLLRRTPATRTTSSHPFHVELDDVTQKFYPTEEGFDVEFVHVPTDEECEKNPRGFAEGTSHVYVKKSES